MCSSKPSRIYDKSSRERIAREMKEIVEETGSSVPPGSGVKALLRAAWEGLDRPTFWRVRAAWHGDAGRWSGEAIDDFRQRKRRWQQRQLEAAEREATDQVANLSRLRAALAIVDEEFHRPEIDALGWAIERYRVRDDRKRKG